MKALFWSVSLVLLLALGACSTKHAQSPPVEARGEAWVVLPFRNHSQTPLAAERVESLVTSALRSRGLMEIQHINPDQVDRGPLPLLDEGGRYEAGLQIARTQAATLGVTGSVEEWRYKTGLDGEPAVGLTIRLVRIDDGKTVWSSSAARSGWSRESLTGNGQKVIANLLDELLGQKKWIPLKAIL